MLLCKKRVYSCAWNAGLIRGDHSSWQGIPLLDCPRKETIDVSINYSLA